jgi:replicative DNA helicase
MVDLPLVNKDLPVNPYLLGALIGDGYLPETGSVHMSSADSAIINRISKLLPRDMYVKHIQGYDYRLTGGHAMRDARGHGFNPLSQALSKLELRGLKSYEKFIPTIYLHCGKEQRIALLHGLMDTDGSFSIAANQLSYTTTSKQLCKDVKCLVQSLGGTGSVYCKKPSYIYGDNKKIGRPSYTIAIRLPRDIAPFRLERKLYPYLSKNRKAPYRNVRRVEFVGHKEAVCISVSSIEGTYITNDYIVTHNTTYGGYLVKSEATRIMEANETDQKYAAHISWEQPVEELEAMYQNSTGYGITDVAWGRVPMGEVTKTAIKRPRLPVWLFGDSLYKSNLDTPPMTVQAVYHAIQAIWKEWRMLPSILFLDFIQNIPVPSERDRYMQVSSAMRLVTRLAVQAKCPIVIGVQANQRTDDYKMPIPTMRDAEWSAVIGQLADAVLALWRPIKSFLPIHEPFIDIAGVDYPNTENLFVMKLLKQRFEKGHGIWAQHLDPNTLIMKDYELGPTVDLTQF